MKGRRKVKTGKWHAIAAWERAARELLQSRSEKRGRLLDIAAEKDLVFEPVGSLCGLKKQ